MEQLSIINDEGTTIMLVTHDIRWPQNVQESCIVDGNIKGEYNLERIKTQT